MLAGCSNSTLLSPRHRLRAESLSPSHFQARHFQLPSMNTHRLDLPCTFSCKDSSRAQPIKPVPVSISVEKPIDSSPTTRVARSLQQHTRLPPLAIASWDSNSSVFVGVRRDVKAGDFWEKGKKKSLKRRYAEQSQVDESLTSWTKRKKSGNGSEKSVSSDDSAEVDENFSFGQLGRGHFWFQPSFHASPIPFAVNCSGDEERACFVPSELVSSPLLSRNAWVQSVSAEITNYGEKEKDGGDETSHGTCLFRV